MILEVQHETRLTYSEPVTEAVVEVRMEPASDADQSCHSFHLATTPAGAVPVRFQDGLGNRIHTFNLLAAHREIRILAAGIVETHRQPRDLSASRATFPLDRDQLDWTVLGFLKFRGPVRQTPLLEPLREALRPQAGTRVADLVLRMSDRIHAEFTYERDVTLAHSPIDDLLRHRKGVCQDFTHLLIALLRSFDVPARYVSGYIHRPNKESQSHAWCEAYLPDLGWVGIDPTNACLVGDRFVKVAIGRDFTDVPPNKGVYRGRAREAILVRVETRPLERLPSLSWQEQLPPLDVPLTEIVTRLAGRSMDESDAEQQQQQ
jgi:transglutaminase-like putative cysteine protease